MLICLLLSLLLCSSDLIVNLSPRSIFKWSHVKNPNFESLGTPRLWAQPPVTAVWAHRLALDAPLPPVSSIGDTALEVPVLQKQNGDSFNFHQTFEVHDMQA